MDRKLLTRIDSHVIGWGALISLGSAVFWDLAISLSVLIGALIAVVNWVGFRWVGVRMATASSKSRTRLGGLLVVKMAAVLGLIALVLRTGMIDTAAFLIGLSALVLGIISRSTLQGISEGEAPFREEEQ